MILDHKFNHNYATDVTTVNVPENLEEIPDNIFKITDGHITDLA